MRSVCLLLLFILLAAGPAEAVTRDLSAVPVHTVTVLQPVTSPLPHRVTTTPTTTAYGPNLLNIRSIPEGAAINIDGSGTGNVTPATVRMSPGPHTLRLTLAGYRDYVVYPDLPPGSPALTIVAQLVPAEMVPAGSVHRQNVSAAKEKKSPATVDVSVLADLKISPVGANESVLPEVSQASGYYPTCDAGQECLTLSEAEIKYEPGQWWYLDGPCGYLTAGTVPVPKYCTEGTVKEDDDSSTTVPHGVRLPMNIEKQATNYSHEGYYPGCQSYTSAHVPVVTPGTGMRAAGGPLDAVIGFFTGLFSRPS